MEHWKGGAIGEGADDVIVVFRLLILEVFIVHLLKTNVSPLLEHLAGWCLFGPCVCLMPVLGLLWSW